MLSALFVTFINNLLPILLISSAGFLVGKLLGLDPRPLSRIVFYLFSPLLIFNLLTHSTLEIDQTILTVAFCTTITFLLVGLAYILGRLVGLQRPLMLAVVLTSSLANTGNYGLPLISFAFGEQALAYGTLYFVMNSIFYNSLGVIVASLGHVNLKAALLGLFKVPSVYTIVIAILFNVFHVSLPLSLARTVDLAGNATIPLMLVLLGLEMTRVKWSHSIKAISLAVILRLVVSPLVGILLAVPFQLEGPARQGNVLETGMPAAVVTTVLASEYKLEPELVTAIVFVSTLLSPLTLTPLLVLLGR
jgi:predicted permease